MSNYEALIRLQHIEAINYNGGKVLPEDIGTPNFGSGATVTLLCTTADPMRGWGSPLMIEIPIKAWELFANMMIRGHLANEREKAKKLTVDSIPKEAVEHCYRQKITTMMDDPDVCDIDVIKATMLYMLQNEVKPVITKKYQVKFEIECTKSETKHYTVEAGSPIEATHLAGQKLEKEMATHNRVYEVVDSITKEKE